VGLRPIKPPFHLPQIDDVADQVDRLGVGFFEEVMQKIGPTPPKAEVNVGEPDGAEPLLGLG